MSLDTQGYDSEIRRIVEVIRRRAAVAVDGLPVRWWDEATAEAAELSQLNVYSGAAGIAVFFHHAARVTKDGALASDARLMLKAAWQRMAGNRLMPETQLLQSSGLFCGLDGVAAAAAVVGALGIERPNGDDNGRPTGDLMDGLLGSHLCGPRQLSRRELMAYGRRMAGHGIAHGPAGAVLLAALIEQPWSEGERVEALQLLDAEAEAVTGQEHGWCNGVLGVDYVRALVGTPSGQHERQEALIERCYAMLGYQARLAHAQDEAPDCSLCHGVMGALVMLHRIAWVVRRADLSKRVRLVVATWLDQVAAGASWSFGADGCSTRLGLMSGLAGVGLALCYFAGTEPPLRAELGIPVLGA